MPVITSRPTWAAIDLDNLRFNFNSSRRFIGGDLIYMAVVKADAYGHGAPQCARVLEESGADWLAVALPEEGVELRGAGIRKPILCLGGFWPGQESLLMQSNLTPVVFVPEQAEALNYAARSSGRRGRIHVKIDTGMGRLGLRPEDVGSFAEKLKDLPNLELEGLMTHFAAADLPDESEFTQKQISVFNAAVETFRRKGFDPRYCDLANSPASVAYPESRGNMVRLGGILYGLGDDVLPSSIEKPDLRPVLSFHTRISLLKKVPAGETLGYGRTFTTTRSSIIASIPVGYHDGYRRSLSNKSEVLINGKRVPVAGRISMDWTIVDVTDVPGVELGDQVVLIGQSGEERIAASDLARAADTISYEITCGISRRVPRMYRRADAVVEQPEPSVQNA